MTQQLMYGRLGSRAVVMTALSLALLLTVQVAGAQPTAVLDSTFETGLKPWKGGADPETGAYDISRAAGDNVCPKTGAWYANLRITTSTNPQGGLWLVAPITALSGQGVVVDWVSKDKSDPPTARRPHAAIAYVGTKPPVTHSAFTPVGDIEGVWTSYHHTAVVPPTGADTDLIYIAVGFGPPLDAGSRGYTFAAQGGMKIAQAGAGQFAGPISQRLQSPDGRPGLEQVGVDCITVRVLKTSDRDH
jgi:hypothetical protein